MLSKSFMASVFVLLMVAPAFADASSCYEPIPPAAVDGGAVSVQQMKAAHDDVVNFIKASDDYQLCLNADFLAQKEQAKKDKKQLDPSIEADVSARIDGNQSLKEKVGAEFNTAVAAYKAKHP